MWTKVHRQTKKDNLFLDYMTQLSRRYLKPEVLKKITDIFIKSFSRIIDEQMTQEFFEEFFTPTEKMMFAKRIVCLYLLYKKVGLREISDVIKISTSTAVGYQILLEKNQTIKEVFKGILREEKFMRFMDAFSNEYLTSPPSLRGLFKKSHTEQTEYEKRKNSPI